MPVQIIFSYYPYEDPYVGRCAYLTTSLALAEKIAAKRPELRVEVSRYICGVFLNKDVGLQTKAAKLMLGYKRKRRSCW